MFNQGEKSVVIMSQGQKLLGNLCIPFSGAPAVVCSHGLESSKDGDKWLVLAPQLCDAGIASLRFSYRGCGEDEETSEGDFADTTLTSRLQDYQAAINFISGQDIARSRLGVIGSSFGSMVAVADRGQRVKAMVLLAIPLHIDRPGDYQGDDLKLSSGRRLKAGFFDDLKRYDLAAAVRHLACPLLVIQGSQDEVVPVADAREIFRLAPGIKRLEIIEGGSHVFDRPEHLDRVVKLSLEWFRKYL